MVNRQTFNIHAIVSYAKEYRMFWLLIGISLLCCHHWCQLAAVKKTRVQADNLGKYISGNYRSPSFAFQHQHLSQFSDVHYLVTTIKFFKLIFRLNLFHLPIDHLHKLFSPLPIEFIRMELRLIMYLYQCTYCDFFASGLLFTEITKKVWIKLI